MKKVLLRAPILTKSGYGEHSRQVLKYLLSKKNIDVRVQPLQWGHTPWMLNVEDEDGLIGEIFKRTVGDVTEKFDVTLQVQLPNEWNPSLGHKNIGITAGVETDRCNPIWVSLNAENMDLVVVPSKHTKKTFEKSGVTSTPITVVPESYFKELDLDPEGLDINLKSDFNFLTVGVLTGNNPFNDRKNLMFLIKWFVEEFKNDPNVGLIIKTSCGRDTTLDRRQARLMLNKVLQEVGHKGVPHVYLLHGPMNRKDMNSLYKHESVKAFVSLTRGEGFGLPHLESAVAGLPVIATNWSAHTEFLNLGKWLKVDYNLEEIHHTRIDNNIFVKGSKWAFPDEKDFKKKVRNFYKKPNQPKKWAQDLSLKLKTEYSTEAINAFYDKILGEYLA